MSYYGPQTPLINTNKDIAYHMFNELESRITDKVLHELDNRMTKEMQRLHEQLQRQFGLKVDKGGKRKKDE